MWIVVNSVCQREKGAGGDLQPQTNKTIGKKLPMRVRTSVMAVTARESKGSPVLFVCWYCKPRRDRHHGDASMQETDWHKADIDEQELNIIEKYKLYYKDKYGVNLSRNAIIRMLVCRLEKEINEVIK